MTFPTFTYGMRMKNLFIVSILLVLAGCASQPEQKASAPMPAAPTKVAPAVATTPAANLRINCTLDAVDATTPSAKSFAGTCQIPCSVNALAINFEGVNPQRACTGEPRVVTATIAPTSVPNRWLGTMVGVQPEDPTRFEVVPNKNGDGAVGRLPYGWFELADNRISDKTVKLMFDANRQVRPNADDIAIIDRAVALLPNANVWNKKDTRECPAGAKSLSLFCALMQATTEISGGVHYRQPAMQAVREELNRVDPARIQKHRIMDYNNHPDTTLGEIHALLERAKARVRAEIK
jgi:hypothetical protein